MALCCAFASADILAWGDMAHKSVGAIADRLIESSNAKKHVDALLLPGENLSQLAVWADCVKSIYCGPHTPEMTDFINLNPRHHEYHYTNPPYQSAGYHDGMVGSSDVDIVQTLKQAIMVLQGKSNKVTNPHRFTPRQALMVIAHLVGDIHQPLHVGAGYVDKNGRFVTPERNAQVDGVNIINTFGGNNLLLEDRKYWPSRDIRVLQPGTMKKPKREGKPLHLFWDVTVAEHAMRRINANSPDEFADFAVARKVKIKANTGDPASWPYQWANESMALARQAYASAVPVDKVQQTNRNGETYFGWFITVPADYMEANSVVAENQIIKGGYRFAALLKSIWPRK